MGTVIDLLDRVVYGMSQVDRVLGLKSGTARRWIDGYQRGGKQYPPVVRESSTGDDLVTWGEFLETRLLAEFREKGVALARMRPAVDCLREELNTKYPLASAKTWLATDGRELVRKVQDEVGLDTRLSLVVVRSGQHVLDWSDEARDFQQSSVWSSPPTGKHIIAIQPDSSIPDVVIDPFRSFGEPTLRGRNVRTEVIGELVRAGETPDGIAEMYNLTRAEVDAAVRYELVRSNVG